MRRTNNGWVAIAFAVVVWTGAPLPAWGQNGGPEITFSEAGLSRISLDGHNYVGRGSPIVDGITFVSGSGAVRAGVIQGTSNVDQDAKEIRSAFPWGAVSYKYTLTDAVLAISITVHNSSAESITSLRLTPMVLRLPGKADEYDGNVPLLANSMGGPAMATLTAKDTRITVVDEEVRRPLVLGFPWALDKPVNTVFPLRITTGRESMYPDSVPAVVRPIPPGTTDTYDISLRFSSVKSNAAEVVKDISEKFAGAFPSDLDWSDRRPIASLIVATANAGWHNNPRGWLLDPHIDITTPDGLSQFQSRLLAWADNAITTMKRMNAQGMITWDIEGEQFPHPVTYIGDPREVERLAPEIAPIVDRYFEKFRQAGFRVGVTVRPQELTMVGGKYQQEDVADSFSLLNEKIRYAKDHWGATLFYIDSNGDPSAPLDAKVLEAIHRTFPDILLIPEHRTVRYYASTAPYMELRQGHAGTESATLAVYPSAFSVVNVADGDIEAHTGDLRKAVARGDILLFRGWFQDPLNTRVDELYRQRR